MARRPGRGDLGGAPGREDRGEQTGDRGDRGDREQQRAGYGVLDAAVDRLAAHQRARPGPAVDQAERDPETGRDECHQQRLDREHAAQLTPGQPHRPQQRVLPGPLQDRQAERVADADQRDQHRDPEQADRDDQQDVEDLRVAGPLGQSAGDRQLLDRRDRLLDARRSPASRPPSGPTPARTRSPRRSVTSFARSVGRDGDRVESGRRRSRHASACAARHDGHRRAVLQVRACAWVWWSSNAVPGLQLAASVGLWMTRTRRGLVDAGHRQLLAAGLHRRPVRIGTTCVMPLMSAQLLLGAGRHLLVVRVHHQVDRVLPVHRHVERLAHRRDPDAGQADQRHADQQGRRGGRRTLRVPDRVGDRDPGRYAATAGRAARRSTGPARAPAANRSPGCRGTTPHRRRHRSAPGGPTPRPPAAARRRRATGSRGPTAVRRPSTRPPEQPRDAARPAERPWSPDEPVRRPPRSWPPFRAAAAGTPTTGRGAAGPAGYPSRTRGPAPAPARTARRRRPHRSPDATTPTTVASASTEENTCRRDAPTQRSNAISRVRWAITIVKVLPITRQATNSAITANMPNTPPRTSMPFVKPSTSCWIQAVTGVDLQVLRDDALDGVAPVACWSTPGLAATAIARTKASGSKTFTAAGVATADARADDLASRPAGRRR